MVMQPAAKSSVKPKTDSYRSRSIKTRTRRTAAEMGLLSAQMIEVAREIKPCTIRQLFYQLVSRGLIDKTEKAYRGSVIHLATQLRRSGAMPFNWIADNTRWMRKPRSHESLNDFLAAQQTLYRRDLWQDQPAYVEIWLEKDALSGVLWEATRRWDVPLMVCKGYASVSFLHSAADVIERTGKPAFLYYFGDCDPSGRDIPRAVERSLREMAPGADIKFEVVAVTDQQIEEFNLPTRPTKKTDSRSRNFDGESVEVDALPPKELIRICNHCIEQHIDQTMLSRQRVIEKAERATLTSIVANMTGGDDNE